MIALNWGSGQRPFPKPWINIDIQARWEPDIVADCSDLRGHIFDGQTDYVVCHQTLEHYGCGEAVGLVREAHRVLKPGGSLLVFVPDMRALCKAWLADSTPDGERFSTQVFLTACYGAYMGDEVDRHRWAFTSETLGPFLSQAAPWAQVRRFDWRMIEGANLARAWWVLAYEAVK